MKVDEFVGQMRSYEENHNPDGWPIVQMREISALCSIIEAQRAALENIANDDMAVCDSCDAYQDIARAALEAKV
jgi:hypothetical protein